MAIVLFWTASGFLAGLVYVMIKRKIKPGNLFIFTLLGLLSAGASKLLKSHYKKNKRRFF